MSQVARLLQAGEAYAARHVGGSSARPTRRLAVVTCMDARIDVFAVLGLEVGDAHVIRNAGARVTDDVRRSLAVSTHVLGVNTVVVMQHTGCGLAGVTDEELRARTGAEVEFIPIDNHDAALREDVELLARTPFLEPVEIVAGFVYDLTSGQVTEVVRWERGQGRAASES